MELGEHADVGHSSEEEEAVEGVGDDWRDDDRVEGGRPHHLPELGHLHGLVEALLDLVLAQEVRRLRDVKVGVDAADGVVDGQGEQRAAQNVQVERVVASLKFKYGGKQRLLNVRGGEVFVAL